VAALVSLVATGCAWKVDRLERPNRQEGVHGH